MHMGVISGVPRQKQIETDSFQQQIRDIVAICVTSLIAPGIPAGERIVFQPQQRKSGQKPIQQGRPTESYWESHVLSLQLWYEPFKLPTANLDHAASAAST